jgi:hypothetical protein
MQPLWLPADGGGTTVSRALMFGACHCALRIPQEALMEFGTDFSDSECRRLKALDDKITCPFFRSTVEDVASALSLVRPYEETLELLLKSMSGYRDAVYLDIAGRRGGPPATSADVFLAYAICDILNGRLGARNYEGIKRRSVFEFFCRYWRSKLEPDLPQISDMACREGRDRWRKARVARVKLT